jgi:hypothetical protein
MGDELKLPAKTVAILQISSKYSKENLFNLRALLDCLKIATSY